MFILKMSRVDLRETSVRSSEKKKKKHILEIKPILSISLLLLPYKSLFKE